MSIAKPSPLYASINTSGISLPFTDKTALKLDFSNFYQPITFTMLEDEKHLIKRAKDGEATAFGLLYDHYLPKIYRFVLLKVSHREAAEDLTHQAFLKAWENIAKYKDEGFPLSSWLYRIARNAIIDHYRSIKHSKEEVNVDDMMEELVDKEEATVEEKLDIKSQIYEISSAIKKLKELEQDVVIMRFIDDMPNEEVASVVGKSVGAVKLIQHRAVKKIKDILEKGKLKSWTI